MWLVVAATVLMGAALLVLLSWPQASAPQNKRGEAEGRSGQAQNWSPATLDAPHEHQGIPDEAACHGSSHYATEPSSQPWELTPEEFEEAMASIEAREALPPQAADPTGPRPPQAWATEMMTDLETVRRIRLAGRNRLPWLEADPQWTNYAHEVCTVAVNPAREPWSVHYS